MRSANAGDVIIYLTSDISEWQVGDTIVFGASNANGTGFEKGVIAEIDSDANTITL
jgi:hypothetical protein